MKKPVSKKKAGKSKKRRRLYIGGGVFSVLLLLWLAMQPPRASIKLGICRTFAELRTLYPEEMRTFSVLERPMDVRMEYTVMNEFGDDIFHTMTCVFKNDAAGNLVMDGVIVDRKKIDPAEIEPFNETIPGIIAAKPDLVIPFPGNGTLMALWRGQ